jgi:hypothetical protein
MQQPIYIPLEEYRFVIPGKPWVQKNNLLVMYKNPAQKKGAFIGHSKDMSDARDRMSNMLFSQYQRQGGRTPIDFNVEVDFVFYVARGHEPDLDNLPAIVCDAMQGIHVKGAPGVKVAAILKNDIRIRKGTILKIVEGDIDYVGEPRTELAVRRYLGAHCGGAHDAAGGVHHPEGCCAGGHHGG